MNSLHIYNDKLVLNESEQYITDLFSNEMYDKALAIFSEEDRQSVFSNELFQRYAVSYIALQSFIEENAISDIVVEEAKLDSIIPWLIGDIKSKKINTIKIKWACSKQSIKTSKAYSAIMSFLAGVKLISEMFGIGRVKLQKTDNPFSVIRTNAARGKISHVKDIELLFERIDGGPSVYGLFPLSKRIRWIIRSIFGCKEYKIEQSRIVKRIFGEETLKNVRNYYSLRNVHTYLYSILIDALFQITDKRTFVSGNNLDRYAIVEEKLAKKNGIATICIPHGLEYGFKLPHCFTGDIFYSTSDYAAGYLNKLYSSDKFIFDQRLMTQVYKQEPDHHNGINRIVFFTEPTENYINREILQVLYDAAQEIESEVWVKLHPKDDKKNYEGIDFVKFDDNYRDAICDNLCIARKSTTLLEATYNNSKPCAVILIGKDEIEFNTFPSLQSPLIHVAHTKEALIRFVLENLKT